MRNNIPLELRQLPQWVVAAADKVPLDPKTGGPASVTDSTTWGTFEQACRAGLPHVGFVLAEWDPYTIIDLDDKAERPATDEQKARFAKIIEKFDSYTERSSSGRGVHIIVRGKMPAGVHRDNVEVYSSARYMICTGDVLRPLPIADRQDLLDAMYSQMKPAQLAELEDREGALDDEDLVAMAMRAANGDKFNELCRGDWQAMGYESQSEADMALLSILAYYSLDNEQVRRIFRMSNLGQREKATKNDKYLNYALGKIRAQQPPLIDMAEVEAFTAQAIERAKAVAAPLPQAEPPAPAHCPASATSPLTWPPGLVGSIAEYIYQTAIRPVPEAALVGALGLVAGIAGRQFNTYTGAGLNLYLTLLGKTAIGKEGGKLGVNRIVKAVRASEQKAINAFVGPASFSSGQALQNRMAAQPCLYSVFNEFGYLLKRISSPRANAADITFMQQILAYYSNSGMDGMAGEGAYSDSENNISLVDSPSFTIMSEATPDLFYECIDASAVASGFASRFLVVECAGDRPDLNEQYAGSPPPDWLVRQVAGLVQAVVNLRGPEPLDNKTTYRVCPDPDGLALLRAFNQECDQHIRGGSEIQRELWGRAHLNALKVSALLAVGNPQPVVTAVEAQWSITFVRRCVQTVLARFEKGEVGGSAMGKGEAEVRKAVLAFLEMTPEQRSKKHIGIPTSMQRGSVVPYNFLSRRLRDTKPFSEDKRLLGDVLAEMVKGEVLHKLSAQQALEQFNTRGDCYSTGPHF
ncbi:hypothetical protein QMA71_15325 [Pseudomonas otitidis]|uniref:phage NrS-1 polymerase family protein n=1 Tax=Metapseudomonas otitidis TaxID=319939 RepID=UPI0024AE48BB|nr:hypothetical protein [Pseudomonas otitidis]MDI6526908.1 hypothetical protein [Pseudomonas otitidis]